MKRLIAIMLATLLIFSICPLALAASPNEDAAKELYALGLFRGTGTDENGNPVFELEREATRVEALVMLIRLLGKEAEALNGTCTHPFTDVPAWADKYVGYAYENGLTNGVSATEFDPASSSSADVYFTFVLRALGYSDRGDNAQFTYRQAKEFARSIGLTDLDYSDTRFLRGDAAKVSLAALAQPLFGEEKTLLEQLVQTGAVEAEVGGISLDAKLPPEGTTFTLQYSYRDNKYGDYYYSGNEILSIFPNAAGLLMTGAAFGSFSTPKEQLDFLGISENEFYVNEWLSNRRYLINDLNDPRFDIILSQDSTFLLRSNPHIIVDQNFQSLGVVLPSKDTTTATITVWYSDILDIAENTLQDFKAHLGDAANHKLTFDYSKREQVRNEKNGFLYECHPVYLDGKNLPNGSFLSHAEYFDSKLSDLPYTPEEILYDVAYNELYSPILANDLQTGETMRVGIYPVYFSASGVSCVSITGKLDWISVFVAFDKDLNVLGYIIEEA